MCGIFAFLTKNFQIKSTECSSALEVVLEEAFMEGKNRGPEDSGHITSKQYNEINIQNTPRKNECYWYAGFHRLAINGLTEQGMQPFVRDGVILICNGEIYNYKELYADIEITENMITSGVYAVGSDCQVIIDYYLRYGIEYTVSRLHGVFAFVMIDTKKQKMFVARDRVGIRALYWASADAKPLYRNYPDYGRTYIVASELKQITSAARCNGHNPIYYDSAPLLPEPFAPGHFAEIDFLTGEHTMTRYWSASEHVSYSNLSGNLPITVGGVMEAYKYKLVKSLYNAVKRRVDACEREVCCLLSGGLDSSLIASMVSRIIREKNKEIAASKTDNDMLAFVQSRPQPGKGVEYKKLKTFSIGMRGSEDLRCARLVADFIDSDHTEIIVTNDEMFDAIPKVVQALETYDTTTVRASVGNYLVCKYIREHCDAKVVFNGDGADEVMGGYLYFQAIDDYNTHCMERLRLLGEISNYDVLRSDKSIAGNGLEARTPYLDPEFIRTYFAVAAEYNKSIGSMTRVEKELIREALKTHSSSGYKYLPDEIVNRRKEAFSDGVSGEAKSWKEEIEERIVLRGIDKREDVIRFVNDSDGKMTVEQAYYKELFYKSILKPHRLWFNDLDRKFYERLETRWMPRYVNATDPSARTLDMYASKK